MYFCLIWEVLCNIVPRQTHDSANKKTN